MGGELGVEGEELVVFGLEGVGGGGGEDEEGFEGADSELAFGEEGGCGVRKLGGLEGVGIWLFVSFL